jgi:hypothetical protein
MSLPTAGAAIGRTLVLEYPKSQTSTVGVEAEDGEVLNDRSTESISTNAGSTSGTYSIAVVMRPGS